KQLILAADGSYPDLSEQELTEKVVIIKSGEFDGLAFEAALNAIAEKLAEKRVAERKLNYRLLDWGDSLQLYWRPPIP
ncbi:hypothetical protein ACQWG3_26410, partial [Salmonella enterica subsp. enterica serovar Infantis]